MSRKNDELARDWPKANQFRRSIRLQFAVYASLIILVMMLVTGYVITDQYVESATFNVIEKLLVQARSYSRPAGKHLISPGGPDALLLNNICEKLVEDNPDVYWVGVTGKDNIFLAHTDIKQVVAARHMSPVTTREFGDILREGEAFNLRKDTIYLSVPITEGNIQLGKLGIACSVRQIAEAQRTSITTVVSITILVLLLGLPFTMFILHRKLRPISVITDHLKKISFDDITLDIPVTGKNEFGYLAETLRVMGIKLNAAQQELIEKERVARELEIAREIQANILPREYPKALRFEFSGIYSSAREVGGDYYDFIDFGDEYLAFLVADVSGKSLPGMLVMLLTRDIVKVLTRSVPSPAELLAQVNERLLTSIKKGMFVTMFFGLLNKKSGQFTFASAGHNPLIRLDSRTGKADLIKTNGFPLGMMPPDRFGKRIETGEISLNENDWLIQYTDGINEAQNLDKEEFGMERFVRLVEVDKGLKPAELVAKIIEQHKAFVGKAPQYDDITLLAMKWTGESVDPNRMRTKEAVSGS